MASAEGPFHSPSIGLELGMVVFKVSLEDTYVYISSKKTAFDVLLTE